MHLQKQYLVECPAVTKAIHSIVITYSISYDRITVVHFWIRHESQQLIDKSLFKQQMGQEEREIISLSTLLLLEHSCSTWPLNSTMVDFTKGKTSCVVQRPKALECRVWKCLPEAAIFVISFDILCVIGARSFKGIVRNRSIQSVLLSSFPLVKHIFEFKDIFWYKQELRPSRF